MPENVSANAIEAWEESLLERYPEGDARSLGATPLQKAASQFRDYEANARPTVREFYRLNHTKQTYDFVRAKKADFLALNRRRMGVWQAMEFLNELVDDSDPDTDLSQIEHLLQTAEAIRADGHPPWFQLTGLIHDLGKILCLFGEPQWAVVGDTFPVGCAFDKRIVFHEFFAENPDSTNPAFTSPFGVYEEGCGLDSVHLSWGHDEYLYHVVKDYLPAEALAMIRFHSFYPWHKEGAYMALCDAEDHRLLKAVRAFNPYDLYSKGAQRPNVKALRPYYEELIASYFPPELCW